MTVWRAQGCSFAVQRHQGQWVMVDGNLPHLPAEGNPEAMAAIREWKRRNIARFNELAA